MNIWVIQFDFDLPHIFVGDVALPTNIWEVNADGYDPLYSSVNR
jgi:hypothetical protein